jgi:hypothetical protein
VLALAGLADDEPFGPEWPGPEHALAASLLQAAAQPVTTASVSDVLNHVVRTWALSPATVATSRTAAIAPQTRVVAAGAGAILALAEHFQQGRGLDLAAQVLLVAASPGERQLLGIAAALLGSTGTPRYLAPGASADAARASKFDRADLLLVSDDAAPDARTTAEALARALGA